MTKERAKAVSDLARLREQVEAGCHEGTRPEKTSIVSILSFSACAVSLRCYQELAKLEDYTCCEVCALAMWSPYM